jgi:PAS domain S-box-containing protein
VNHDAGGQQTETRQPAGQALRVLLVEDSESDAILALRALGRHGYETSHVRVETRDGLMKALDEGGWDLILADCSLPQFSGLEVPDLVASKGLDIPVIAMSGVLSEDVVVTAIRGGAGDYVMKDNMVRLGPAVDRLLQDRAARRVHEQTAQERRLLSAAIRQAAEAIMITDTAGTICYVNPAFERVSGYSQEEALGRRCSILRSGKHGPDFYRDLWSVLHRGETWRGHFVNRRKDGRLYEEDAVISPVLDGTGEVVNYVAVKRDITQEVLLEKQLIESRKMDAIGRLAGGLAHDFTNMLVVILSSAQAARRMLPPDSPAVEHMDTIVETARRSGKLTGDLLSFAQQQEVDEKEIDLNKAVERLKTMLQRSIGSRVNLAVEPFSGPLPVRVDPEQMDQAIVHLVVRAKEAMPDGGHLTIATSCRKLSADERRQLMIPTATHDRLSVYFAVLTVTDTGTGMTQEEAAHAFEPFFASRGRLHKAGLALPTVYGIVRRFGGVVTVYSRQDLGTTFTIYVPLRSGMVPGVEEEKPQLAPHGTETVLLVEDHPIIRRLLCQMLQQCGYGVLEAEDSTQALALAQEHGDRVAILVADVALDSANGKELSDRLTALHPGLKTVFVSGYPKIHLMREGVVKAEDTVIQKPFSQESVAIAIRAVLDRHPPAAAAR